MWLLSIFSPVARAALRGFYHFQVDGDRIPHEGPALLVANHPNSLLDPAAVVAVAGRPVRFLAKAPLFRDPLVGWLVRGAAAIPVHRRQDAPQRVTQNDDTFRAAREAIHAGDAIGIFPEGLSHSEPSLAPLRTGAARIALGAAEATGSAFPVIPIGLVFHEKQLFRSPAIAIVGAPIAWDDLASRGEADAVAVRELTRRIAEGLQEVTINLERRNDARVVLAAERIFNAERGVRLPERERVHALREVSTGLARLRSGGEDDWLPLARSVTSHARRLHALGLQPDQLTRPAPRAAALWTLRQLLMLALLALPGLLGTIAYWTPFRVTDLFALRHAPNLDTEATYKLLAGIVVHLFWTLLIAGLLTALAGPLAGLLTLVVLPVLAWTAVRLRDRWADARATARRFLVRARREALIGDLRTRQAELAVQLAALRERARS